MRYASRPAFFFSSILIALGGCQLIGGLDELRLGLGEGGAGGAGIGGAVGSSGATSSTGSNGVGGSGGGLSKTAVWSKRFGDDTTQNVTDVAVDGSGNIFVVGTFLGTLDFGPMMVLTSADDYDAFLAKLDTDGNPLWAQRFGGIGPDRIESLSLTTNGDPVVGGSYSGAFSIGGTNLANAGGLDAFVIRFSGMDGSMIWNRHFGDTQNQRCASVSVATNTNDVFCLADFSGVIAFGGGNSFTSSGLEDLLAVRYSADGAFVAALRAGDAQAQMARNVVVDGTAATYLAARFDGKIDWGPVTSAGQGDVFLGKFTNNGAVSWALRMGDSNTQQPNGMALAGAGAGIVLVGDFEGATDFGGKAITSKGGFDAFITRVDAAGVVSWIRTVGDGDPMVAADDQHALDVAVANDGSMFVTGFVGGTVNFGNNLVAGPGDTDFFLMRLDAMGQTVWALRSGGTNSQFGRAVALSGTDDIIVAGDFRTTLDFGNEQLTSVGSNDIFIAKLKR